MTTLVIIKHFRYTELTDACLASIKASMLPAGTDVLVVDSTPDADYVYGDVRVVKSDNALGLIESLNRAIDGQHDLYVCLNNDTVVHPRWLVSLQAVFERDARVGVAAPLYDQPGGGLLELVPPFPPDHQERAAWLDAHLDPNDGVEVTRHVDNCVWAFPQRLVSQIGLPDGAFPGAGWGANLDYCYRARVAGWLVVAARGSFISHRHRATYGRIDPDYVANAERQRDEVLCAKYGNPGVVW
jgi:GT2 family glycosyltransferase